MKLKNSAKNENTVFIMIFILLGLSIAINIYTIIKN